MAKTLLEFEGEIIDVLAIYRISKVEEYDVSKDDFDYKIIFNRDFDEKFLIRNLTFKFNTLKQRDRALETLLSKIGDLEHINIL